MDKYTRPEGSLISFMSDKVKLNGGINLAQGLPGFSPHVELLNCLKELAKVTNIHQYASGNGESRLLELIQIYYSKYCRLEKSNLLITNGATEAISLIFIYLHRLINKPFKVLAFDPAYESYKNVPLIFGNEFISFSYSIDFNLSSQIINFESLEKTIIEQNVKIIFVNSPGNPLGKIWSKDEVNQIFILAKKLNFYVIFDGVYKEIYFEEEPYQPIEKLSSAENLFYVNSFSKHLSITGWRIGYMIANEKHINKIKSIHDYIGLCSPSVLQKAIICYLENYNFGDEYVINLRKQIKESYDLLSKALIEFGFKIPEIKGGYFIWSELPENYNDGFRFAIDLYDSTKVAIIPGIHFSDNGSHFVRFNIARPLEEIKIAIEKITKFIS